MAPSVPRRLLLAGIGAQVLGISGNALVLHAQPRAAETSGPGPIVDMPGREYVADHNNRIADTGNPILKPWAKKADFPLLARHRFRTVALSG
jgi:hypothetical protein